jgi:hypothetical protein
MEANRKSTVSHAGRDWATDFLPLGILFFAFQSVQLRANRPRHWTLLLLFMALVLSWWSWMERVLRLGQVIWVFACVLSVSLIREFEHRGHRSFRCLLVACIAATSLLCASVALHSTLGQLRKQLWSRSQIYNYPPLIDQLPPGSRGLHASRAGENNFPLAGAHLSNHVIANFEVPSELTQESLGKTGADYLVEVLPPASHPQTFWPGPP